MPDALPLASAEPRGSCPDGGWMFLQSALPACPFQPTQAGPDISSGKMWAFPGAFLAQTFLPMEWPGIAGQLLLLQAKTKQPFCSQPKSGFEIYYTFMMPYSSLEWSSCLSQGTGEQPRQRIWIFHCFRSKNTHISPLFSQHSRQF